MELSVDYAVYTDKGNRDVNEDSIDCSKNPDKGLWCFTLCDGLGGHGRGEIASQAVTESVRRQFEQCDDADSFFDSVLDIAQTELMDKQQEMNGRFDMKTTAVLLLLCGDTYRYAHIGDSRFYHFRRGRYKERTIDHSVPQILALSGDIKEKDIRNHPDRNRLLHVMGVEWSKKEYKTSRINRYDKNDAFLLCSDGFWELITEKEMGQLLKKSSSAQEWLEKMTEIVRENGKNKEMDNNSAIAVIVGERPDEV